MLSLQLLQVRADLAARRGDGKSALALRDAALGLSISVYGQDKMETLQNRIALAETQLQFGHAGKALAELDKVAPVLSRMQVDGSPDRRKVEGLLLLARGGRG